MNGLLDGSEFEFCLTAKTLGPRLGFDPRDGSFSFVFQTGSPHKRFESPTEFAKARLARALIKPEISVRGASRENHCQFSNLSYSLNYLSNDLTHHRMNMSNLANLRDI